MGKEVESMARELWYRFSQGLEEEKEGPLASSGKPMGEPQTPSTWTLLPIFLGFNISKCVWGGESTLNLTHGNEHVWTSDKNS